MRTASDTSRLVTQAAIASDTFSYQEVDAVREAAAHLARATGSAT
jgi:hypothetical protein